MFSGYLNNRLYSFIWTLEAISHSQYKRCINPRIVENVLHDYVSGDPSVQSIDGSKWNVKVFQQHYTYNLLLRVVVDITTHPWTIITFYKANKRRYWSKVK